jgi:phosphotransferase system enzyme I (PtsI)
MYLGTAASPGIAMGKALIVTNQPLDIVKKNIEVPSTEIQRFQSAISQAKAELTVVRDTALQNLGPDKADIFDAHIMLLEDPEVIEQTHQIISADGVNAEYAYDQVIRSFAKIFENMNNEYMRERASDIRDVSVRVLKSLLQVDYVDLADIPSETILVAHDLTPSDTAVMNKKSVKGFVTDIGGRTSHTAIIARTLGMPAVVGMKDLSTKIKNGDLIVLNGDSGEVFVNPSEDLIFSLQHIQTEQIAIKQSLEKYRGQVTRTLDGHEVELGANIGTPKDIEVLLNSDAESVGLYRTEFIYMNRNSMPTEDEQFEAYKAVLQSMGSKPVIIRTLDVGGDKSLPYLKLEKELNPFLGYRAIRICLDQVDVFKTQLRALLRASVFGNLKIMFPMISSLEEIIQAKEILMQVQSELTRKAVPVAGQIEVGIMIEIPSAAVISDLLAQHVDFFSIGTNDLIQYMCAVDRMNEKIHHLYNPYNPGVLRIIKHVIDSAHKGEIWCGMCGEVAGDPGLAPLLLGMGLDEFSMSPNSILPVRKLICSLSKAETESLWASVSKLATATEIERVTKAFIDAKLVSQI